MQQTLKHQVEPYEHNQKPVKDQLVIESKFIEVIKGTQLKLYQYPLYKQTDITSDTKTIIFVGQTGAGKTLLINNFINYLIGIQWDDPYRFQLISEKESNRSTAQSMTQEVKVYYIKAMNGQPALQIIDTPGFGDTRGIQQDTIISDQIKECFLTQIDSLHLICFVVKSSDVRMTQSQNYVISKMLEMFGNDVKENFVCMLTFSDDFKSSIAIEALKFKKTKDQKASEFAEIQPGIQEPWYLHFNSLFIYKPNVANGEVTSREVTQARWIQDDNFNSFDQFMKLKVKQMKAKSLTLTQKVIRERSTIYIIVSNLRVRLVEQLSMISVYNQLTSQVSNPQIQNNQVQSRLETNKIIMYKQPLEPGVYVTNCKICNSTCHFPCMIPQTLNKESCTAMSNGKCTICKAKCPWNQHQNDNYRYVKRAIESQTSLEELKILYYSDKSSLTVKEQILTGLKKQISASYAQCMELQEQLRKAINHLKKIALQPGCYETQQEYVDQLIEEENNTKSEQHKERIVMLQDTKRLWSLINSGLYGKLEIKDILSEQDANRLLQQIQKTSNDLLNNN